MKNLPLSFLGTLLVLMASCATSSKQAALPPQDLDDGLVPALEQGLPLLSPENPLPDGEKELEVLLPPLDLEKASLVNEKPRVSPIPRVPPAVREAVLAMERPVPPVAGSSQTASVPQAAAAKEPGAVPVPPPGPSQDTPAPAPVPAARNPVLVPRQAVPPASLLKSPPEPDLTPVPSQVPLPQVEYEDVTARPGDEVYFQFTPQGWIFADRDQSGRAAGYVSMDLKDPARTVYLFRPEVPGTFILEFRRNDLVTGLSRIRQIRLQVVAPGEVIRENQIMAADLASVLEKGLKLEKSGRHQEALDLYLVDYNPSSQELNWRLAGLSRTLGRMGDAESYWSRNLETEGPWTQSSWKELVQALLNRNSAVDAAFWAHWGKEKNFVLPEDSLLRLADQLGLRQMVPEALEWLEEYALRYPGSKKSDQALFLRAQFLEREGPQRNIRESLRLYRKIQLDYPLSPWWTSAVERAGELERQFLRIR